MAQRWRRDAATTAAGTAALRLNLPWYRRLGSGRVHGPFVTMGNMVEIMCNFLFPQHS